MATLKIPGFIKNTPHYVSQSFNQVKGACSNAASWTSRQFYDIVSLGTENDLVKPIYERYIRPIDIKDGLIFGACAGVACAVMFTAIAILGKPIITLAVAGGLSILCLSGLITNHRIKTKLNHEAAAIYMKLHKVINRAKFNGPLLDVIETQRAKLRDKKYEYLKESLKPLDQYINQYTDACLSTNDKFINVQNAFSVYLKETYESLDKSLKQKP